MRKWSRIGLLAPCLCVCALAGDTPPIPDLPTLNLNNFPVEVRSQVQQAYDFARQHPRDAEASGQLGMVLDLYDRPDVAAVCYQRAHQLEPRSFKWLYYLGSLQAKQKKSQEAVAVFREALQLNPTCMPVRLKLAESLVAAGNLDASNEIYYAILKDTPELAEAYYGLGRISVARGHLEAARESFHKACELFPPYGAAHYALAQVDWKLGRNEEAQQHIGLYTENKNLVPPVPDPLRDALRELDLGAVSHLKRGVALEQVGRLQDAIAEHEKALKLDPKLVTAHVNLIALYGRLGNGEKAEEHYREAVALNPGQFASAHYYYGVLQLSRGQYQKAEQAFREALQVNPFYSEARNNLGYLLERQGQQAEAIAEYRKAIESNPDYRQAHFNLGRILVNQKQYNEGIQQLSQTLKPADESTPTYLYALGAAYARAGDRRNALRYIHEAQQQASARGQSELLASIERDLRTLEKGDGPP